MLLTTSHRTENAIRFLNSQANAFWLVIGQATPWSDDTHPPASDPTATSINSPVGAAPATLQWVIEDSVHGTIDITDALGNIRKFSVVNDTSDCLSLGVTQVLVTSSFVGAPLFTAGFTTFRQFGFASGLVPGAGHGSDPFLLTANITSFGVLETTENNLPIPIVSDFNYNISEIIQF